jgi:hypothetical protein
MRSLFVTATMPDIGEMDPRAVLATVYVLLRQILVWCR